MKKHTIKKTLAILLSAATLFSFAACGGGEEGADTFKVGISQIADHPSLDNCRMGFIEGLKQNGYEEGVNLEIDFQSANGDPATQNTIISSFVTKKVDLICGIATPTAQAAYNAAQPVGIPVVFSAVSDPVLAKLATTKTDGVDGISGTCDELPIEAQLKMIRALLPDAKRVGILYNTSEINSISQIEIFKTIAVNYGLEIVEQGMSTVEEMPTACDKLLGEVDCITNLTDNMVVNNMPILIDKAAAKNIPVFGSEEEQVKNGCLATEGLDYFKLGVKTGEIAAKVLSGEDINELDIEIFKEPKFFINKAVAEKLEVELPAEYQDKANYL